MVIYLIAEDEEEINVFDPKYFKSEFENVMTLKSSKPNQIEEKDEIYDGVGQTFVLTGLPAKRKLEHFSIVDLDHSPYSKISKRRQNTFTSTPTRCT